MPSQDHLISNLTFPRTGQDCMVESAIIRWKISCLEFSDERMIFFQLYLRSGFLCFLIFTTPRSRTWFDGGTSRAGSHRRLSALEVGASRRASCRHCHSECARGRQGTCVRARMHACVRACRTCVREHMRAEISVCTRTIDNPNRKRMQAVDT